MRIFRKLGARHGSASKSLLCLGFVVLPTDRARTNLSGWQAVKGGKAGAQRGGASMDKLVHAWGCVVRAMVGWCLWLEMGQNVGLQGSGSGHAVLSPIWGMVRSLTDGHNAAVAVVQVRAPI